MKKQLLKLLEENRWNITEAVIQEALDYHDPESFFKDLLQHWCGSWMVTSLIYYHDTHKFYEQHYDEIEELRTELDEQWLGVCPPSHSDLKNFLAWLWFEETARKIYCDLEMNHGR